MNCSGFVGYWFLQYVHLTYFQNLPAENGFSRFLFMLIYLNTCIKQYSRFETLPGISYTATWVKFFFNKFFRCPRFPILSSSNKRIMAPFTGSIFAVSKS